MERDDDRAHTNAPELNDIMRMAVYHSIPEWVRFDWVSSPGLDVTVQLNINVHSSWYLQVVIPTKFIMQPEQTVPKH